MEPSAKQLDPTMNSPAIAVFRCAGVTRIVLSRRRAPGQSIARDVTPSPHPSRAKDGSGGSAHCEVGQDQILVSENTVVVPASASRSPEQAAASSPSIPMNLATWAKSMLLRSPALLVR